MERGRRGEAPMTLQTRINGLVADQSPNQKGSFERLNPYLTYEASTFLSDSAKIPTLPDTPTNRQIFGYIDIPGLGSDVPRFRVEQYVNGHLTLEGIGIVTDFTPTKGYSLTIVQPLGEFFGDIQFQKLNEIDFGTIPLPSPLPAAGVVQHLGQDAICFPSIRNQEFYGTNGTSISYTGIVNDYTGVAYTTTGPKVPFVFVRYLLHRIATLAGITIDGPFTTDGTLGTLCLYNIREQEGASIILNRHLPDLTVIDFLVELRKYLNLSFKFDTIGKRLSIAFTDTIHNLPCTQDWSYKLVQNPKKILERNRRLQLTMELDSNDATQKDRPLIFSDYLTPDFADNLGIARLSTKYSTLATDTGLAIARQQGATSQFAQLDKKSTPRLLFWHGVTGGYPKALPDLGGKSLYWHGPTGLINWAWAKTEAFRRQIHYLDCQLILSEYDLAMLDFTQKIHINGVNYLIVRLSNTYPITTPTTALLIST